MRHRKGLLRRRDRLPSHVARSVRAEKFRVRQNQCRGSDGGGVFQKFASLHGSRCMRDAFDYGIASGQHYAA